MSTAEFVVYLLGHESTRELGLALGAVVALPVERPRDGDLVVTLPC